MKKPGGEVAQITPDSHGWRLHHAGKSQSVATLSELIPLLPAQAPIHLAIPTSMVLMERQTLPSTDREELSGMVQLQLEKTLPYPVEEVTSDFQVLSSSENESTVSVVAVHGPALSTLCQPLRDRRRLPQKITVFGEHVAATCPEGETVLALWMEQEQLVVAVCESGKLGWAHSLAERDAETVQVELPRLLLSAEMEGVPTAFTSVMVASEVAELVPALREALGIPVLPLATEGNLPVPETNLLPGEWGIEARGYERTERIKQQLMAVAVVYLILLAGAFVYLAWTKRRVQVVDREIAQLQPQLTATQARQAQWQALAPAIDPSRYAVELLYQVTKARPSESLAITTFDSGPDRFSVEGEAPNAAEAIAYSQKLQSEEELSAFQIEMPNPPSILPNEHAQFRIFGKL